MQVKDLLIEALSRANHIQRGFPAEGSEVTAALQHFNSQLRKYSDANLITAYQKVVDFVPTKEKMIIGAPTANKGIRIHWIDSATSLPDLTGFDPDENPLGINWNRDIYFAEDTGELYYIKKTVTTAATTYDWSDDKSLTDYCSSVPDIIVRDMQRISAAMIAGNYDDWIPMQYIPLVKFYTDDRLLVYTTGNSGENKVSFISKSCVYSNSKTVKLVYTSSMKFDKNDTLELPEAHIELLTLAVTCAILTEDVDADQTQFTNYKNELTALENQIIEQASTTRTIYRDNIHRPQTRLDELFSGSFLYR